ncbi:MAG: hypothetical protein R3B72_03240 [Polyangiaceae bacterium]
MIARAFGIALFVAPIGLVVSLGGCGTRELPQDICNWLADANNCHARFANDVGQQCGYAGSRANDPIASTTGYFAARDDLSLCIKNAGGQVLLGSAPTPDMFPLTEIEFTLLDAKAAECGKVSFVGEQSYQVTINPVDKDNPGASTEPDGSPLQDDITGGTFSVAADGPDVIDVSCPGGEETFTFNKLVLDKCSALTSFQPRAFLDSSPGAPESTSSPAVDGYIRFQILYPPEDPTDPNAQGRLIEYFNCRIPAPPAPCVDGVKNNDETDIDCGGSCAATCAEGQGCNVNADCTSGNCGLNGGFQQCLP